jgi:outer membrane scaffolding protein for murein synthesis (MipA/OmpV family)
MKKSTKIAAPLMLIPLFASAGLWAYQREEAGSGEKAAENPTERPSLLAQARQFATDPAARGSGAAFQPAGATAAPVEKTKSLPKLHHSLAKGNADTPAAVVPEQPWPAPAPLLEALSKGEKVAVAGITRLPEARPPVPTETKAEETTTFAFGAGGAQMPRWLGSNRKKSFSVPYININWKDRVEFSTTNGLIVDLIHNGPWHGGVVGTMMWGRSYGDMGSLSARVPTRTNTVQGGLYLEYAVTKELSVGTRVRHDIQGTGAAYADVYADMDLPSPGLIDHSVRVTAEAMNRSAMRRYFGVASDTAAALGTSAYQPGAGASQVSVSYDLFVPTSQSTGVAFSAGYGRLARTPGDSPLVRDFGSVHQRNAMAAFLYHF